jgi:glycogen synthase
MEESDLKQLLDLSAYIRKAGMEGHLTKEAILRHVEHDVDGLLNKADDEFWTPRTTGWDDVDLKALERIIKATE